MIAVLIVFHAGNGKNRTKKILKQDSKSSKEDQSVVAVANPPGSSSKRCRCCRSVVAPLSHRYRFAVTPLLLCCRTAITPMSHRYRSAAAPLLFLLLSLRNFSCYRLHCRSAVAPLSLRCRSTIDQLSLRCCSAAASVATLPLLSLLLSLRFHCCYIS